MSESMTIARPYAKAIFNLAKNTNTLEEWDNFLSYLSVITNEISIINFIKNKTIYHTEKSKNVLNLLESCNAIDEKIKENSKNFIDLLAFNNRLFCIKEVTLLYKEYMNLELNRIEAVVKTACAVNNLQKDQIINSLSKKFNKNILASFELDEEIIGGFIVKIGDFVLDGSVIGNLRSLRAKIIM